MAGVTPSVGGGTLAVGLAAISGIAAALALSVLATPSHFRARVAQAEAKITSAEAALEKGGGRGTAYAAAAVCQGPADVAAASLKAKVQAAASVNGVTLASLAATAGPESDGGALRPIALQFEATGRNDLVIGLLRSLARQSPSIFVDTADLSSQVSSVDLKFAGEVYCSARA